MDIGAKIKSLRLKYGLTQEELADRAELSKGFISQLERNLTSPSIITLIDILECLGTTPGGNFSPKNQKKKLSLPAKICLKKQDVGKQIVWLVPNAQKNMLEPILLTLQPGCSTDREDPHEGEEFGYVLSGSGFLYLGAKKVRLKKNASFYYRSSEPHYIENRGKKELKILWVSSPPSF